MRQSCPHDPAGEAPAGTAAPVSAPHEWRELDLDTAVTDLGEAWRALLEATDAPPTVDPVWQQTYWRAFRRGDAPLRVHALPADGGVHAIIPVRRTGRLVRRWSSGVNGHTPRRTFALTHSAAVASGVVERLMASVDVLDLGPAGICETEIATLAQAARRRGLHVSKDASGANAVIDLPASWNELRRSLPHRLVSNTDRALRQLRRLGRVSVELVTDGESLRRVLGECFALETLGWKGLPPGAPIGARPDTLQFYADLAQAAAAGGWLALYTLRLDSTLIAFEYCLRQRRSMELMKLSFHPDFARYSPGNVLRFAILEREIESFCTRSYYMGPTSEWKARWATRVETLCRLRIYRPGVRGTLAYVLGSWIPGAIRRHAALRSMARWLRQRAGGVGVVVATAAEVAW